MAKVYAFCTGGVGVFHIGYKKLRKLIDEHPDADFILWNGTRPQIKRRKFEAYIDENLSAI